MQQAFVKTLPESRYALQAQPADATHALNP